MNHNPKEIRMNSSTSDMAALVGRILLAVIFLISGFGKITGTQPNRQMQVSARFFF